jgi:hypothetical protein
LSYCLPPRSIGEVVLTLTELGGSHPAWTAALQWQDGDWHDEALALAVAPGDYLLAFEADRTWSNAGGRDGAVAPENRALGLGLSSATLVA